MTDPKMALTRFTEVYAAKAAVEHAPGALGGAAVGHAVGGGVLAGIQAFPAAPQFRSTALSIASSGSVHENDQAALFDLQAEYSISSVEELLAVARLKANRGGK